MRFKKKTTLFIIILFTSLLLFQHCKDEETPTSPEETQTIEIGNLEINPDAILVNTATDVIVKIEIPSNIELADTFVQLQKVEGDKSTGILKLFDNGKLENGDDIIGDNVYSGILEINESSPQTINLVATAKVKSGDKTVTGKSNSAVINIYAELTSKEHKEIISTQESAVTKFQEFLGGNISNINSAVGQTVQWLQGQSAVESVKNDGSTSILIKYKSGLYGGIVFSVKDANGSVITRGGYLQDRKKTRKIPLRFQTVGEKSGDIPTPYKQTDIFGNLDPKIIGNRNVFIYAPYEAAFAPYNERASIEQILKNSEYEFSVSSYVNQEANIAALTNLTDYGLVILATHGSMGEEFATGEIVDTNSSDYKTCSALRKAGKLSVWENVTISNTGGVEKTENIYAVRAPFISALKGKFPNSVILNNSCESMMNPDLSNAFTGKGAKTYFGYSKVVNSDFCVKMADSLVKRLAQDLKNTGDAYLDEYDPNSPFAHFEKNGANDVHYPASLINGDFEFGKIDGWTKEGDGRVISKLSSLGPTGGSFMGIISTGLGFTTSTGTIFQSFRVEENQTTLTIKWNFLSEEFLEYINSQFQDFFKVMIKIKNGNETVLLHKTIDGIAADFGAQKFSGNEGEIPQPGDLIGVSPEIVFDRGDVYMTGWQTSSFDISSFQGKVVTLYLMAGDVGDSIFDTAILLDDITIK